LSKSSPPPTWMQAVRWMFEAFGDVSKNRVVDPDRDFIGKNLDQHLKMYNEVQIWFSSFFALCIWTRNTDHDPVSPLNLNSDPKPWRRVFMLCNHCLAFKWHRNI
jgi:hypothetical protein